MKKTLDIESFAKENKRIVKDLLLYMEEGVKERYGETFEDLFGNSVIVKSPFELVFDIEGHFINFVARGGGIEVLVSRVFLDTFLEYPKYEVKLAVATYKAFGKKHKIKSIADSSFYLADCKYVEERVKQALGVYYDKYEPVRQKK